ncbi:MAG: helix-turn-helix domain-containing protein [Candidatus Aenigmarchaeota archaeon]|nr:helix-turn-helix domain-containing protein [Candidatus Aenigmarchaeota archaeon]MDI6722246.1 helix-turn-helix domain-containing protein [Candidatus Aenigmarchaeota archaeon]
MHVDGRKLSHETNETIRMMAVRRVKEGEKPRSVIANYGLCRTSIYRWLRAEKKGGKDPRNYSFDTGLSKKRFYISCNINFIL